MQVLPPHPHLKAYYATSAERGPFVRRLFDATAADYDRLVDLFSFGTARRHRARMLEKTGIAAGHRVLDVASGTGLVAALALRRVGPPGSVAALDLSYGMLRRASRHAGLLLIQGTAEALPIADGVLDLVTMGYALRHVTSLDAAFAEYARVLRPGGQVLLLEFGRPSGHFAQWLASAYLGFLVPRLSRLARSGRQAETLMRYCWDTIESCVPPETILAALEAAGFRNARVVDDHGIFRTYLASRQWRGDSHQKPY